jgi:hypothetical protein
VSKPKTILLKTPYAIGSITMVRMSHTWSCHALGLLQERAPGRGLATTGMRRRPDRRRGGVPILCVLRASLYAVEPLRRAWRPLSGEIVHLWRIPAPIDDGDAVSLGGRCSCYAGGSLGSNRRSMEDASLAITAGIARGRERLRGA